MNKSTDNKQTNKQTINYAMLSNTLIAGRLKIGGHRSEMLEYCFFFLSLCDWSRLNALID